MKFPDSTQVVAAEASPALLQVKRNGELLTDPADQMQAILQVLVQIAAARAVPAAGWDRGRADFSGCPQPDGSRVNVTIEAAREPAA